MAAPAAITFFMRHFPALSAGLDSRARLRARPSAAADWRYCDGTYVGSVVRLSITDPYAATRPVPLMTRAVMRPL